MVDWNHLVSLSYNYVKLAQNRMRGQDAKCEATIDEDQHKDYSNQVLTSHDHHSDA